MNALMIIFSILMALNALMLVRFWWMMRMMNYVLLAFIDANRQFLDVLDQEKKKKGAQ
jgi:hypothetical protein